MKKISITPLVILVVLLMQAVVSPAYGITQPVGTIATKVIGIPTTAPSARLGWSFNGFTENATSTHLHTMANITQRLAPDVNKTITAGTITTPLSKVYSEDGDNYTVPSTGTPAKACVRMNITLSKHYVPNATWIDDIDFTVKAAVSDYVDTAAAFGLYNFTGNKWVNFTILNSTSLLAHDYHLNYNWSQFIDPNSNTLMMQFYWENSTGSFTGYIDYVCFNITYSLYITVSDWQTRQASSLVSLSIPANHNLLFWENATLTAPTGATGYNITVYIIPPDKDSLGAHTTYVNGSQVTNSVSNGIVSFNITNFAANSTALMFRATNMITTSLIRVHYPTGESVSYKTITWNKYQTRMKVQNNFNELYVENVSFTFRDYSTTPAAEVHPESCIDLVKIEKGSIDITASCSKSPTQYVTPTLSYLSPSSYVLYTLTEALPPVHLIQTDGLTISSASFQGGINKLTFTASGTGSKTIVVYITSRPYGVYVDGHPYSSWTWSNNNLTITYDFGSTHKFEIYQYNPSPPQEKKAAAPPPTTTSQPTTTTQERPDVIKQLFDLISSLTPIDWIVILLAAITALYIYKTLRP